MFWLPVLSGIFLGLSFPPFNLNFLLFPGYAILIYIIHQSANYRQLFRRGYLNILVFMLITVSWISLSGMRENADRFLILGGFFTLLMYALLYMIPVFVYYTVYILFDKKIFILFAFPFIWTAFEYTLTATEISFPWLTTGNAFTTSLYKIQFIEFTGVYGISFWALNLSCLLFYIIICLVSKKKYKRFLIIFLLIFLLPNLYSFSNSSKKAYSKSEKDNFKVGIVQPNIDPWRKWDPKAQPLIEEYSQMINELISKDSTLNIIILPETAVPSYLLHPSSHEKLISLKQIVEKSNIPILTGFAGFQIYNDSLKARKDSKSFSDGTKYDVFNSVVLIDKDAQEENYQVYNKNKLVAASERMPYQESLPFLKNLISWGVGISSYQIGLDTTVFVLKRGRDIKFSTVICYESIYPSYFAKFVEKGAEFCVIVTNDGWWGKLPGTYQHNNYAILRAIENRRWIVRCGNTGISGVIDPYGNYYDQTEINTTALIISEIGLRQEKTFYSLNGDLFAHVIFCSVIIFFFISVIYSIARKKLIK